MNDSEVLKLQLQQAIETYRAQYDLMVRIATTLLVADAAVIWHAIITEHWNRWYICLLGALLVAAAVKVVLATAYLMKPVAYTAVSIEQSYRLLAAQTLDSGAHYDGLASMFLSTTYQPQKYIEKLEETAKVADLGARRAKLSELDPPYKFGTFIRSSTGVALSILFLVQWFGALVALFFFGPWFPCTDPLKWTCWQILAVVLGVLSILGSLAVWLRTREADGSYS